MGRAAVAVSKCSSLCPCKVPGLHPAALFCGVSHASALQVLAPGVQGNRRRRRVQTEDAHAVDHHLPAEAPVHPGVHSAPPLLLRLAVPVAVSGPSPAAVVVSVATPAAGPAAPVRRVQQLLQALHVLGQAVVLGHGQSGSRAEGEAPGVVLSAIRAEAGGGEPGCALARAGAGEGGGAPSTQHASLMVHRVAKLGHPRQPPARLRWDGCGAHGRAEHARATGARGCLLSETCLKSLGAEPLGDGGRRWAR
eukprot:CAMPEP_0114275208 /NCGR_PEP_ID=MMETSP0058-20121206/30209_1 /TAXON_ID=36894 /ORGANISM="Pyramimonas parkeae, CCMP726" /LENGTH=250 /DNA_ID=CAMNT_0001395117 /DNA_START=420 /DNA_END=1173 /DNA_ORIENTATION=+